MKPSRPLHIAALSGLAAIGLALVSSALSLFHATGSSPTRLHIPVQDDRGC
jgi:hypothetical protein